VEEHLEITKEITEQLKGTEKQKDRKQSTAPTATPGGEEKSKTR
jgi:hypothetical protein